MATGETKSKPRISAKASFRKESAGGISALLFKGGHYHLYRFKGKAGFIFSLCDGKRSIEDIFKILKKDRLDNCFSCAELEGFILTLKKAGLIENLETKLFKKTGRFKNGFKYLGTLHSIRERVNPPLDVIVEVTKKCLSNCLHCYVEKGENNELREDGFKEVIDSVAKAGILSVHFTGGEPFLREDFLNILRHTREKNLRVSIDTNGIFLNRDIIKQLKELDIDTLNFGFDGSCAAIYGLTREAKNFKGVFENMKIAIAEGVDVVIFFALNKLNFKDLPALYRLALKIGVLKISIDPYQPLCRGAYAKKKLYLSSFMRILIKLFGRLLYRLSRSKTIISWDKRCNMGLVSFGIHADGAISPCVVIDSSFGNALHQRIEDIWNGEMFKRYIDAASYAPPCKGCLLPRLPFIKSRYFGKCPIDCRAEVWTQNKDIYAGNSNCPLGKINSLLNYSKNRCS